MLRRWSDAQSRFAAVPFPAWALAVCVILAMAGALALDDYGLSWDEGLQREIGQVTLDYVLGQDDRLLDYAERDHQVAFEVFLLLAERAMGLDDARSIYLSRHILTHLFFLAGGFFAALLVYRMYGSRWLALFALLLFVLHPRLYAHSFVNSKDLPFLSMFMIALYLAHRAFRRDTLGAFILCGVAVGLLINIRIMGLMLLPAVLALRGLDWAGEFRRAGRRRHLLLTAGGFAAAALLTLYAAWPWLWGDPAARFAEAWLRLANFPRPFTLLFQGELLSSLSPPWDYIPVWMAITTPPATLLLGLAGVIAVLYSGIARPGAFLRNTGQRFEGLLLACLILPVAAVIALDSSLYDEWRHLYFIYAPFSLLAVIGLRGLLRAAGEIRPVIWKNICGPAAMRGAVWGLAVLSLTAIAVQSIQMHPFQNLYFNLLVDRATPEYLRSQYRMNHGLVELRPGLEYLLERYPEAPIRVAVPPGSPPNELLLPEAQRQRVQTASSGEFPADFYITNNHPLHPFSRSKLFPPALHDFRIYNNTFLTVAALDLSLVDAAADGRYREQYQRVAAGEPVIRAEFDVYLQGQTLSLVKDPCEAGQLDWLVTLAAYPADLHELPDRHRRRGWVGPDRHPIVRFDGKCLVQTTLPEFELLRLRVGGGRFDPAAGGGPTPWEAHYYPGAPELLETLRRLRQGEHAPGVRGQWPAQGPAQWEVFQLGGRLLYAKTGCTAAERNTPFFLHLTPAEVGDLPEPRRRYGYDNLDFPFQWHGLALGEECIALAPLPDYPITAIATGQYTETGRLWQANFTFD